MTQNSVRVVDPTNTEPYVEALLEALTLKIEKNNKSDWLVITIEFGGANRSLLLCKEDSSPIDEICDKFKTKLKKTTYSFQENFHLVPTHW